MAYDQNKKNISHELLQILVCPVDKEKLEYNNKKNILSCHKCNKKYNIKDGIPILLNT